MKYRVHVTGDYTSNEYDSDRRYCTEEASTKAFYEKIKNRNSQGRAKPAVIQLFGADGEVLAVWDKRCPDVVAHHVQ